MNLLLKYEAFTISNFQFKPMHSHLRPSWSVFVWWALGLLCLLIVMPPPACWDHTGKGSSAAGFVSKISEWFQTEKSGMMHRFASNQDGSLVAFSSKPWGLPPTSLNKAKKLPFLSRMGETYSVIQDKTGSRQTKSFSWKRYKLGVRVLLLVGFCLVHYTTNTNNVFHQFREKLENHGNSRSLGGNIFNQSQTLRIYPQI